VITTLIQEAKKFLQNWMACHIPPLKKAKKQGEMPLPSLGPIPLKNVEFMDGTGPRLGNGISPCFFCFF